MRVSVIGCGYLGATHAAGLAELGFEVLGVEVDQTQRDALASGRVPFFEPGLEELVVRHTRAGNLRFASSAAEAAAFADVHFICVGTPQLPDSFGADLSHVEAAIGQLATHLKRPSLVVGKSTVPVGTARRLAEYLVEHAPAGTDVALAWNPEFLREGFAVQDTLHPDRLVFGVTGTRARDKLAQVYSVALAEGTPLVVTDLETAELVKVAANAFLATKISFINAMAEVCEVVGADVVDLADAIGHDARIGRKFLNAGIGFGGGCLPKDIRAFQHRASELGVEDATAFLRDIDAINTRRREVVVQAAVEALPEVGRVAVLGAAFKPQSDDIRDSPALWITGELSRRGYQVVVHDPRALANARSRFPDLHYADAPEDALRDADLVLHLTEWADYLELDPQKVGELVAHRRLIDGRNALDLAAWRAAGWSVRAMGRPRTERLADPQQRT